MELHSPYLYMCVLDFLHFQTQRQRRKQRDRDREEQVSGGADDKDDGEENDQQPLVLLPTSPSEIVI